MKYARIERERRFLLAALPPGVDLAAGYREIRDLYVEGTHLRLREIREPDGSPAGFKLGQKLATDTPLHTRMTNLYLDDAEHRQLAQLPGRTLSKLRYSLRWEGTDFCVDRFLGPLEGLILAEVECDSDEELNAIPLPPFAHTEVTDNPAFTGGELAHCDPRHVLRLANLLTPLSDL